MYKALNGKAGGRRGNRASLALLAVLAIALVMSAFAHRAVGYADGGQPVAYGGMLPDGTLLQICLSEDSGDHHHFSPACEFCHIAGNAGLPPRFEARAKPRITLAGSPLPSTVSVALPPAGFPSAPLRGPPLFAV